MTAMGSEPELRLGESGEWVTHLQERLQALGLYHGSVDGQYGEELDVAVQQLAEGAGLQSQGGVDAQTWQALAHQEQAAGISHGHQEYAAETGHDAGYGQEAAQQQVQVGSVSEDGHWRWDGTDWQPAGQETAGHPTEHATEHGAEHAGAAGQGGQSPVGQLSEDGQWRWDGTDWQPAGQQGAPAGGAPAGGAAAGGAAEEGAAQQQGERHASIAVNDSIDDPATDEAELLV